MTPTTPDDFEDPCWKCLSKCHEWKNYISDEVKRLWETFTTEQKAALARQAQEYADREEWD